MGNCKSKKDKENYKEKDKPNKELGKLIKLNMLEPIKESIEIYDNESINSLIMKSFIKMNIVYYYDVKLYFCNMIQDNKSIIRDIGLCDEASFTIEYKNHKDYINNYILDNKNNSNNKTCNQLLNLLILLQIYSVI